MNEHDLGFGDIYGAGTGDVQSSQDIMKFLFNMLQKSEREEFKDYDWGAQGAFGGEGLYSDYSLQDWGDYLDPSSSSYGGWDEDKPLGKMTSTLFSALQGSGVMDLTKGYGQDVSDISTEMGSKLQGLQKGYSNKTKSGRYGKIGTGGRDTGLGGRNKYMSDIYGLQQKEAEMQQQLQDELSGDFYGNLATWQTLNPSPHIGDDN